MAKAFRAIEDGNPNLFYGDDARVVNPVGRFTPNCRLAVSPVRVDHVIVGGAEFRPQTNCEGPFFGISESDGALIRENDKLAIDDPSAVIPVKFGKPVVTSTITFRGLK